MMCAANKWLTVRRGVVLTDSIDPVIWSLDEYFRTAGMKAEVSSGLRTPIEQLAIIRNEARKRELDLEYPEIKFATVDGKMFDPETGAAIYQWQRTWSRELADGFIVNPPKTAVVLFDYFVGTLNKKGMAVGPSPHFRGTAFDVSGGGNGPGDEYPVLVDAIGQVERMKNVLLERKNNACHVDCYPAGV